MCRTDAPQIFEGITSVPSWWIRLVNSKLWGAAKCEDAQTTLKQRTSETAQIFLWKFLKYALHMFEIVWIFLNFKWNPFKTEPFAKTAKPEVRPVGGRDSGSETFMSGAQRLFQVEMQWKHWEILTDIAMQNMTVHKPFTEHVRQPQAPPSMMGSMTDTRIH